MLSKFGQNTPYNYINNWNDNELMYFFNSEIDFIDHSFDIKYLTLFYINPNFKNNNHLVACITGPPGCGKSMISILIAKQLKASIVRTFNPSDPGDTIQQMYTEILPTKEKPLVVVLDEFDIIISKIHTGITQHKNIPIQVHNKPSWNMFFDDINLGIYQNMILIMTSNLGLFDLNKLYDSSYIRKGRIDNFYELS
jgi:hypothetical protein